MPDPAPIAIQTGDPRFSPVAPVAINGFLYVPATGELAQALASAITERDQARTRIDELLASNTALVLQNRELRAAKAG